MYEKDALVRSILTALSDLQDDDYFPLPVEGLDYHEHWADVIASRIAAAGVSPPGKPA